MVVHKDPLVYSMYQCFGQRIEKFSVLFADDMNIFMKNTNYETLINDHATK